MEIPIPRLKDWGALGYHKMRFLLRMDPLDGLVHGLLNSVLTVAASIGVEVHNPKWTSKGALEIDVFAPSKADFEIFLAVAGPLGTLEFVSDLNTAPLHISEDELFSKAREYFNSERYWECHEVLEGAWRLSSGAEKLYVQGIILVCAAFVHHQKADDEVARGVLMRALSQLRFEPATFHGIDVVSLRHNVEHVISSGRFEPFRV